MAAIDTNVLIRYIIQDEDSQFAIVMRLLDDCARDGRPLFVPITVVLELEWVLRSNFQVAKPDLVSTLSQLLSATELSFQSEAALEVAVAHYRDGTADFADCVHAALAAQAGEEPLWTFDRKAAKVDGAKLLMP
ncbi:MULTISPECIES: PIN domain-containing protein [unclassified Rhizobacter]|uniref:PIN domain-containing protein n=1 Tax=unclassified Rhizobacter TaxID=2640088 RepID=UPI0006F447AF|nr:MULTISPECIES: type II toxin-antitoxin system VapC family toxin [unclassified Rhizobacter]KQU80903.1 twitching motility protein PilT [Rhizobacter sp. Root29]KQW04446.1 twitching motility protein PilT [Rhizobacter sp. Root1238]KRB14423.1 twitching motility protein PilT [Rhizobacter sp. Root16D2]